MELKITDFEKFKMIEQEKIRNKKNYSAIYESNAVKKNIYGGRRFLGFTPKGKDVWVTMKYTRDDMELFLKVDKGFKDLFKEDARLAISRVEIKLNQKKPENLLADMSRNRRNAGGEVTIRLLEYIEKLITAVEAKKSKGYVNGRPSSLLFQYVASIVYPGNLDEQNGFRWMDAIKMWNIPSGEYFTVDSFQKTVDN
mgnify:FL=1|tara:strand:+ start:900 stop:1490 length:591 start_codon:yes stop_codon:yes gene_type:complete